MGMIEPGLRCAAARLSQMLELGRNREQGRAEGLVDALTGLPNRLLFNDRLDTIIREAARNGECFAVLFVDLDRFKAINDTYGHAAGDQVLRTVTQRLCSRSEEHTSEPQSLMRISYAVFCLKKKNKNHRN